MDALYMHFPDEWLFVPEPQPPSEFAEFPVTSLPPQANETGQSQTNQTLWENAESYGGPQPVLQPEIRPEPQPGPQPALQPEPPCIDKLMDELFGSALPQPCEEELDFECLDSLFDCI